MRLKKGLFKSRTKLIAVSILSLVVVLAGMYFFTDAPQTIIGLPGKKSAMNTPTTQEFNKQRHSIDDPASLWAVVNKGRKLPSSYVPEGLRAPDIPLRGGASQPDMKLKEEAAALLETMSRAAAGDGANLKLTSGYRSYSTQVSVYGSEVKNHGQTQADKESARPGHSEHQTGLAADLEPTSGKCRLAQCFGQTAEGLWLAAHAHEYGFIIRYIKDGDALTGYMYEPWHVRFVGVELAEEIYASGQTLEQFFELPAFPDYPKDIYQLKLTS